MWHCNKVRVAPEMYSWLKTAVKLVLGSHQAASLTEFHTVLAEGGRFARLPEPCTTLEADLGTINKLPYCLFDLHKTIVMLT